ncbi:uncharacterized protein LOC117816427 [Notolabrus celidotus]|uniref:uncharacterized protein LOC117816427 n=1 Tax=Notolabrus celidotus TaxID=1203425 RepID=UPI0014902527|nr:uncharacterized protein LOC117816427 [Notolabrus celidotus]
MEGGEGAEETSSGKSKSPVKRNRRSLSEKARIAKRESDRLRAKNRVNIGSAHGVWKKIRDEHGFRTDAEMAFFLINIYLQSKLQDPSVSQTLKTSSAVSCDSVHYEYQVAMSSPSDDEEESGAASSAQSSENIYKESQKRESGQKESRDIQDNSDEESSTSLIVGDGLHLVDLSSSSEFVVDEECILQLFKSCRECNRHCRVRKQVKGLQLVVNQACCFCESRCKWTNLPDDGLSGLQINGEEATQGQTNSALLQS